MINAAPCMCCFVLQCVKKRLKMMFVSQHFPNLAVYAPLAFVEGLLTLSLLKCCSGFLLRCIPCVIDLKAIRRQICIKGFKNKPSGLKREVLRGEEKGEER